MHGLQTRLEATLSLAAVCELEASRAADDVKRENYLALAAFYEGVADELRLRIAKSGKTNPKVN